MENKTSTAQLRAADKYLKTKVDSYSLRVPKGGKRVVSVVADYYGLSINQYICNAIRERLAKDYVVRSDLIKEGLLTQEGIDRVMTALYYDIYDSYK